MRRNVFFVFITFLLVSLLVLGARKMLAQSSTPESMITRAVDETQRVTLRGNVHPMARAEFDQGAVASTMPMQHMMLVLKRSADQKAALDELDAQQADKNSPNYHKWLTPAQFGEQFGPSDQDMTAITTWLGSHGFQVNSVAAGRNIIDFSGTAGEIQEAFHTAIHKYTVNGVNHWANASDPQIPAALAPLVVGVNSLNDFRPKAFHHNLGAFKMSMKDRKATPVHPNLTLTGLTSGTCYSGSGTCYIMTPYDFAAIYNVQPLWTGGITGAGQNIAIVSDSNINTADYQQFRTLMGLPAGTVNVKLPTGTDPGLQMCTNNEDEEEAILDVEWAGAIAPGATIDLVAAPSAPAASCNGASNASESLPGGYSSGFGGDYAAYYAINTLNDPILSDSYGACELELGTNGNTFYNTIWQQANTQGITVLTATGDNGAAGCDNPNGANPAQDGLQVDGTASTPFDTAVGGTDFNYDTPSGASTYWNATNSTGGTATTVSAKGSIAEIVYNDTCTSPLIISFFSQSSAANDCNNTTVISDGLIVPVGGSGGFSACTTPSGLAVSDCSGGYAKPTWQTGSTLNIPTDSKRDIPDVSLFAGDGTVSGTFYLVCQEDAYILSSPPSPATACSISSSSFFFAGEGGTSVSAQAMAGIVALINQKSGNRHGSVALNTNMYALANTETISSCNNSTTAIANSNTTCVFRDITTGTNSMPCVTSSPNCGTTITSRVVPVDGFRFKWTPMGIMLFVYTLCAVLCLPLMPQGRSRWSSASALLLFAATFCAVSCGGGSASKSGSGGGSTTVAPTVTGVSPNAGPPAGGTQVVVTGSSLSGATAVMFGGTAATTFTVNSGTQITATSPAETSGAVNVTVTTEGGVSATSAADQFTFTTAPTVTGVSPNVGPTAGGTHVLVTGTGLSGATAVTFGGSVASSFTVNSATQVTATSPAETAGAVNVTVTTQGGVSATSAADQFTFATPPIVTGVSPGAGPATGGTEVTITGINLSGVTAVTFGGTAAAIFTVNSATQITATSPAGTAGTVNVTVTASGGTSAISAADQFTFSSNNVGVLSGYNAGAGYDRATGLGSVNVSNLVNATGW